MYRQSEWIAGVDVNSTAATENARHLVMDSSKLQAHTVALAPVIDREPPRAHLNVRKQTY